MKKLPAIRTNYAAKCLALGEIREMKGSGTWEMNITLLDDEVYLNYLRISISKWK